MASYGGVLQVSADGELDAAWLGDRLGKAVASARVREFIDKQGGMSGEFLLVDVVLEGKAESEQVSEGGYSKAGDVLASGATVTLALKHMTAESRLAQARNMGSAREACFYDQLASKLDSDTLPRVYFAHGSMETGQKAILMECLPDAVNSGVFFGLAQPNNWGLTDTLTDLCAGNPGPEEVSAAAFSRYAQIHACFWKDKALLEHTWLSRAEYIEGTGREKWEASLDMSNSAWQKQCALIKEGMPSIKWDDHLVKCFESSFGKATWENYQSELPQRPWTLVQGDCHPHNAMWINQRTDKAKLILIDFEMVGVGSPSQELGQYLVSHMQPELRSACENKLVKGYHDEVTKRLRARGLSAEADAFTIDACWEEYVAGGAARWVWFTPVLIQACGPEMGQFFHDQTAAFLKDHVPDPANAPMPRAPF